MATIEGIVVAHLSQPHPPEERTAAAILKVVKKSLPDTLRKHVNAVLYKNPDKFAQDGVVGESKPVWKLSLGGIAGGGAAGGHLRGSECKLDIRQIVTMAQLSAHIATLADPPDSLWYPASANVKMTEANHADLADNMVTPLSQASPHTTAYSCPTVLYILMNKASDVENASLEAWLATHWAKTSKVYLIGLVLA